MSDVIFEILQSKHNSQCLTIDDTRVSGPKCLGGGTVSDKFLADREDVLKALHIEDDKKLISDLYFLIKESGMLIPDDKYGILTSAAARIS